MFDRPLGASLVVVASLALLGAGRDPFTGTWSHGDPERGGGRILTDHVGGSVRFELEAWRGAPSYNSGALSGSFALAKGKGTFRPSDTPKCELSFAFSGGIVDVDYVGDSVECGFGHGVYANGRYRRSSSRKPSFAVGDPRLR